ncbi:hypothetical protein BA177_01440 [Woeseia oceani]|uniref:Secretin/TonB short N-terminal domain-containing protein n=2 Tax=Woeseia oceani TaxID=1548547 RepID=A0A193LCA2_9GAMM|nr:hypothetical protein BA177_01440 [Woeseia oceani]
MLLFTLAAALADDAALDTSTVRFNIPAQTVPAALGEFARQAKVQLFFISDGFENVRANAVFGTYTRQQALNLLLEGTGLRASLTPDSDVEVRPVTSSMNSTTGEGTLLVAANLPAEDEPVQPQRVGGHGDKASGADAGRGKHGRKLEEIVVTGTHIRGVDNVGASSITFSREELDATGYTTVGEVFESLPQNLDEINLDGAFADGASAVASANSQLASGISLRGLGPGSTLVLLNGKRRPGSVRGRAVDVASIPFSMVERIEIVTGGRSAIYGSDAVAGVANIITRTSFDSAETQVSYGAASEGAEQFNFSQTFGRNFSKGGFVLGYDYRDSGALDATDAGLVHAPSPLGITPLPGLFRIRVPSEQHVGLFSGHYKLSDKTELYTDAHYSADQNKGGILYDFVGLFDSGGTFATDSKQYSAVTGVRSDIGRNWQIDVSALHGVVDNSTARNDVFAPAGTYRTLDLEPLLVLDQETQLSSLSVIADGPLGEIRGRTVSGAIGVDFRKESLAGTSTDLIIGLSEAEEDLDRDVASVFAEINLPLATGNGHDLEISLAARYDDYSDFGDTFNPQLGIEWQPADGLTLRGSYSRAFRAPDLSILSGTVTSRVRTVDDPLAPGTTVALFSLQGGNPDLQPEEADTYTVGFDWAMAGNSGLSLSWFSIEYENRIDRALANDLSALQEEAVLGSLLDRNPTPDDVAWLLDSATRFINSTAVAFDPTVDDPFVTFSNIATFDGRANNIGLEKVTGLDFQATTAIESEAADWEFGLTGTYYFDYTRNVTALSPEIDQLNRPGRPVDLKLRGQIGWKREAWNVNAYVNYTDSYIDTVAATPTKIDSWTTVDLTVSFDASSLADDGFFEGLVASFRVSNALDEDPPEFLSNIVGLAYDGVNASPLGRFLSLRLSKRW